MCSKLTIKTPEQRRIGRSVVFIVIFEHTWYLLSSFMVDSEQANVSWILFLVHFISVGQWD